MIEIEYMLDLLHDNHPIWYWVLMRLAICVLLSLFGVALVSMVLVFCAPIAMAIGGSSGSVFWLWLVEPVLGALCWCCGSVACWLLDNAL